MCLMLSEERKEKHQKGRNTYIYIIVYIYMYILSFYKKDTNGRFCLAGSPKTLQTRSTLSHCFIFCFFPCCCCCLTSPMELTSMIPSISTFPSSSKAAAKTRKSSGTISKMRSNAWMLVSSTNEAESSGNLDSYSSGYCILSKAFKTCNISEANHVACILLLIDFGMTTGL